MELWLVRHGPAEASDPLRWPDDDARPLTPEGARRVAAAAAGVARRVGAPVDLATSPALRARATAELLRPTVAPGRRLEIWEELAPGAEADPLFERWRRTALRGPSPPLLVGHAPTLNELIERAIGSDSEGTVVVPRGGLASVRFAGEVAPGRGEWRGLWALDELVRSP